MAININECIVSGTIYADPVFSGEGPGSWGFMQVITTYSSIKPGGGYQDNTQIVQIVADVDKQVDTMRKYLKKSKAIAIQGYYRTWESGGTVHTGIFARKFIFASQNFGAENNNQQH